MICLYTNKSFPYFMPTCQNCGYELVLLSSRPKYKCALCSKLYQQREVEIKAFREWNKKQRENDIYNLSLEERQRDEILIENGIFRGFRFLFKQRKPRLKLSHEEKGERKNLLNKKWALKNPEKVKIMAKRQLETRREEIYNYLKKWRVVKQYESRLKQRLTFWRGKQRDLTLQIIKNESYKLSTKEIEKLLPTWAFTQLLF